MPAHENQGQTLSGGQVQYKQPKAESAMLTGDARKEHPVQRDKRPRPMQLGGRSALLLPLKAALNDDNAKGPWHNMQSRSRSYSQDGERNLYALNKRVKDTKTFCD